MLRPPGTGTFHLVADDPLGTFDGGDVRVVAAGGAPTTHAGRVHEHAGWSGV